MTTYKGTFFLKHYQLIQRGILIIYYLILYVIIQTFDTAIVYAEGADLLSIEKILELQEKSHISSLSPHGGINHSPQDLYIFEARKRWLALEQYRMEHIPNYVPTYGYPEYLCQSKSFQITSELKLPGSASAPISSSKNSFANPKDILDDFLSLIRPNTPAVSNDTIKIIESLEEQLPDFHPNIIHALTDLKNNIKNKIVWDTRDPTIPAMFDYLMIYSHNNFYIRELYVDYMIAIMKSKTIMTNPLYFETDAFKSSVNELRKFIYSQYPPE